MYNWQLANWPRFECDTHAVEQELLKYAELTGRLSGLVHGVRPAMHSDVLIWSMVEEAMKTSQIEGEYISRKDVMSSIRGHLGLEAPGPIKDKVAKGVAMTMMCVRDTYSEPLTEPMILHWHTLLMAANKRIKSGRWRSHEGPMQVVSGSIGRETVHFEAPPSIRVPTEMSAFVAWFNATAPNGETPIHQAPVRSALAHVYFETIHPFEDGNGRIGRVLAEKVLAQHAGSWLPMSMSTTIEAHRNQYYLALKQAQRTLNMDAWIGYFVKMLLDAMAQAELRIGFVLRKAHFFDQHAAQLNPRQLKVLNRMLDEGPEGFEGGMNARKYAALTGVSKASATRDLQDLLQKGALAIIGAGRNTSYRVKLP